MPQKHDNYTRKVFDGIGEGGWGGEVKVITRTASAVKNKIFKRALFKRKTSSQKF